MQEMRKAQCLYQSVRLLLTYHCPTLALHIEHKASLSPELYLTSYVLTLFSRSLDLDTTTKARAIQMRRPQAIEDTRPPVSQLLCLFYPALCSFYPAPLFFCGCVCCSCGTS